MTQSSKLHLKQVNIVEDLLNSQKAEQNRLLCYIWKLSRVACSNAPLAGKLLQINAHFGMSLVSIRPVDLFFLLSLAWSDYGSIPTWATPQLYPFTPAVKESWLQNPYGWQVCDIGQQHSLLNSCTTLIFCLIHRMLRKLFYQLFLL